MRVRLLVIDPQHAQEPPWEPMIVMENENGISVGAYDHAVRIPSSTTSPATLETVSLEQIRRALRLRPDEQPYLHLSAVRALPDEDWVNAEWAEWLPRWRRWTQQWWLEEAADLVRRGCIETSPAVLTAA